MGDRKKQNNVIFPCEYLEVLNNNVVMVTGVGKSGTTVAALLLCSMMPTYHIYEPVMLKIVPPRNDETIEFITRNTFLYDFILPIARGMRICDYEFQAVNSEWQWGTCQATRSQRRGNPEFDGNQIIYYLFRENPLFVINMLNGLPRVEQWKRIFPGMHLIHIARNGFDVIASETMRRCWHRADYYAKFGPWSADWLVDTGLWPMPMYVEPEAQELWFDWTTKTRAAHLWRVQMDMYPVDIRFEDLTTQPEKILFYYAMRFKRLKQTELTEKWLHRLTRKYIPPHELTLKDIQEPERKKFKETMERLGYL